MKRDWKQDYFLASLAVIASAALQFILQAPRARADEPVDWCGTEKVDNQQAVAQGACPTKGTCDTPSFRDLFIPGSLTPVITIRIRFHIFCNDDGTNCASSASEVAGQMNTLNTEYYPHNIQFAESTAAEYINNSTYRDLTGYEIFDMMSTYGRPGQLNVYVVHLDTGGSIGYGFFPWDQELYGPFGGVLIDDGSFGTGHEVLTHESGHNLGLWHTHHGVSESHVTDPCSWPCYEHANGVDGDVTGDFASDTPPTPVSHFCGPPRVCAGGTHSGWDCDCANCCPNGSCEPGPGTDACSGVSWGPTQPDNYMGYAQDACWTMFTPQQAGRMHCWIHDALTSWIACASNQTCDDRNDCTVDLCAQAVCQHDPDPDYTPCAVGVCCGGSCVCSANNDCDDGNACTIDACVNFGTCDAACTHALVSCIPNAPDECCPAGCTSANDFDCHCGDGTCNLGENQCNCSIDCGTPPANEVVGSTCHDGVDNDCDGYADCDDVADCASDPGCSCYCDDNGGNSPLVCLCWTEATPPAPIANFVFGYQSGLASPDVTLRTGNNAWKVWSQKTWSDNAAANLGHIGIDPTLLTESFSLTVAHGASPGAANVASMALVKTDWTGQSNLSGGSIAGSLGGDLILQGTAGQSGAVLFTIEGNVSGVINIPTVNTLQVKGEVSSGAMITLGGFTGGRRAEFNTAGGDFAGDLSLPNGLPEGAQVNIHGLLAGSVDFDGQELAGSLSLWEEVPHKA